MAAIHGRNTQPELLVRRYLFACGFRYRLNSPRLPGHPDLVLRKYRTCIFVNGCFWHGHDCGAFRLPRTNTDFWERKINRNRERDVEVQRRLAEMGWHCITVWGCQLTKKQRELTLSSLALTLHRIYLHDRTVPSLTPHPFCISPTRRRPLPRHSRRTFSRILPRILFRILLFGIIPPHPVGACLSRPPIRLIRLICSRCCCRVVLVSPANSFNSFNSLSMIL